MRSGLGVEETPRPGNAMRGLRLLWKRRPPSPGCDPVFTPLGPQPPLRLIQAWPCLASCSSPPQPQPPGPPSPASCPAGPFLTGPVGSQVHPNPTQGLGLQPPVRFLPPFALCLVVSLGGGSPNPRRASAPEPWAGTFVWEGRAGGGGQQPSQAPSQASSWAHGDPRAGLWSVCGAPCPRPVSGCGGGGGLSVLRTPGRRGPRRLGECHCPGAPWGGGWPGG